MLLFNIESLLCCFYQLRLFQQVMQEKLKQAKNLAEMYREQCIALEGELALIREENDAGRELFKVPPVFVHLCKKLFSNLDR